VRALCLSSTGSGGEANPRSNSGQDRTTRHSLRASFKLLSKTERDSECARSTAKSLIEPPQRKYTASPRKNKDARRGAAFEQGVGG